MKVEGGMQTFPRNGSGMQVPFNLLQKQLSRRKMENCSNFVLFLPQQARGQCIHRATIPLKAVGKNPSLPLPFLVVLAFPGSWHII